MNPAQQALVLAIRLYRLAISPVLSLLGGPGSGCRFTPTCSEYGMGAVRKHGAIKGGALTVWRLARCHPWGGCGCDPVPGQFSWRAHRLHFFHRSRLKAHGS
jgi:putative membrane protein insertion efficiency factor